MVAAMSGLAANATTVQRSLCNQTPAMSAMSAMSAAAGNYGQTMRGAEWTATPVPSEARGLAAGRRTRLATAAWTTGSRAAAGAAAAVAIAAS